MKHNIAYTLVTLTLTLAAAACHATASGVVTDTKANTTAVKGAVETLDVKTAILADKTIDAGAIDVDTFGDKKLVVLRGSVPTDAFMHVPTLPDSAHDWHRPAHSGVTEMAISTIGYSRHITDRSGAIDAITFTSATQVPFLFRTADALVDPAKFRNKLKKGVVVVSVGEVTSRALKEAGVEPHVSPSEYKMGPMVKALAEFFEHRKR